MKKIKIFGIVGIVCFILLSSIFFYTTRAYENTTVEVHQEEQVYEVGQQFNVSIMCYPTELVKAYEFKVSYNQTIFRAESVSEGNIFHGYETFYSPGIIDNENGTIINIYGLILGQGNISQQGSLSIIKFTCLQTVSSPINLYEVGITNSTEYIPVSVINATISIGHYYDVNSDNKCDLQDILLVAFKYGNRGSPGWIPEDVDRDGVVGIYDFLAVSMHFGQSW